MTVISRIGSLNPRHRRVLLTIAALVILISLAIPVGLNALHGGLSGGPTSSAIGVAEPAKAPPAGESRASADAQSGSAASGSAASGSAVSGSGASGSAATAPDRAGLASLTVPKLARSAWLGVKVKDVVEGSAKVRAIALSAGGEILSENVVTGPDPTGGYGTKLGAPAPENGSVQPVGVNEAQLTLSVPAERLDAVLAELSSTTLGTVSYRSSQSEDVTDTYIDTKARIQPAKDSIDRIRALLAKATSLDQVVQLESELSRRQADLDSLQQRFAELERRTTMSQVSVTLWTNATEPVVSQDGGFLGALKAAGAALLSSLMIIVTGLAVLLPWLLVAAVVAWFVRRWLRQRRSPAATT